MKQVTGLTSTYSSDAFGVCSALYELGGMVVMHDASGCNSTYTTHDEPRWYDVDSMIYVSAISEKEAVLGDDEKLIRDLTEAALELKPKFIALVLAPVPFLIGTDVKAIAAIVEERTGIPCFAFLANGMHDYTAGVSQALLQIVRIFAGKPEEPGCTKSKEGETKPPLTVNLLGVTPLDFSIHGSVEAMRGWVTEHGMRNGVCLAMDCTLSDITHMTKAQVNLVVSSGGLFAAKWLWEKYSIPYVVGAPFGEAFSDCLAEMIRAADARNENVASYLTNSRPDEIRKNSMRNSAEEAQYQNPIIIIGEAVTSASLASAIEMECGIKTRVFCPLASETELLRPGDKMTREEDDLIREIKTVDAVIADPLYRPLCTGKEFYPLPHTAFSGRIFENKVPNLIAQKLSTKQTESAAGNGKIC